MKRGDKVPENTIKHTAEEMEIFYRKYSQKVYKVCFSYMKNEFDAADIMQEVFMKWLTCKSPPKGDKYEIAWLVVTAGNLCKNHIRDRKYSKRVSETYIENIAENCDIFENNDILETIMELDDKYKTVVYLFYYEGMSAKDIAKYTKSNYASVRSRLSRARKILKEKLGGYDNYEK